MHYGDSDLAWSPRTQTGDSGVVTGEDSSPVTVHNVTKTMRFSHNPSHTYEQHGFTEYIELRFEMPVFPTGIKVGENRGMCSIVRIQGRSAVDGAPFVDLWRSQGTGTQRASCWSEFALAERYRIFEPDICQHPVKVDTVRLELDTRSVNDWNEIDFVELSGTQHLPEGVLPANASGVFYVPNLGFAGDDSLKILPCTWRTRTHCHICCFRH